MKIEEIDMELASDICMTIGATYHLTNYFIIKENLNTKEISIFCYAGSDIIKASNIIDYMNEKDDKARYYTSNEIAEIS